MTPRLRSALLDSFFEKKNASGSKNPYEKIMPLNKKNAFVSESARAMTDNLLGWGLLCLGVAFFLGWTLLLSLATQCVLGFFLLGLSLVVYALHKRGLNLLLPKKTRDFIFNYTLRQFMTSSMFKDVPLGDLFALLFLPLDDEEKQRVIARMPDAYRMAMVFNPSLSSDFLNYIFSCNMHLSESVFETGSPDHSPPTARVPRSQPCSR